MTALALAPGRLPGLPRGAIAFSLAVHAAALFLLPGLTREVKLPELPPLMATLRFPPVAPAAAEPAAPPAPRAVAREVPQPAPRQPEAPRRRPAESRPKPRPVLTSPLPRPEAPAVREAAAVPAPAPVRAEPAPSEAPPIQAAQSAPPAPAPVAAAPAAPDSAALDDYGRALSELLAHQQQYPRLAALRGWEGEVRLRLRVARKGALVAVQIIHSSGYEVLDQHALKLVQGAPLPPPPEKLGDREIQVVVPIHYKLQKPT